MKTHKLVNAEKEVLAEVEMTTEDAAARNVSLKAMFLDDRWVSEDEPPVTPVPRGQFL